MKRLVLFDGHALIYRAFHALPPLTAPDGELVNAVYGFSKILLTVLQHYDPEYVAVTFDHPQKTFRHQVYKEYKAHRPEMPVDLRPQVQFVKEVVRAFNIPQFELAGFEADDLIGTLAAQAEKPSDRGEKISTLVVTGDKDLLQLVDEQTHVFIPKRGAKGVDKEYDADEVANEFGFSPRQLIEYKALRGDPSDNIPGVKGVGEKTALKLIHEFGTIDRLYEAAEKPQPIGLLKGSLLQKLLAGKKEAFLSRQLASIDTQAKIKLDLQACRLTGYDKAQAIKVLERFGFKSLYKFLPADEFEAGVQSALF